MSILNILIELLMMLEFLRVKEYRKLLEDSLSSYYSSKVSLMKHSRILADCMEDIGGVDGRILQCLSVENLVEMIQTDPSDLPKLWEKFEKKMKAADEYKSSNQMAANCRLDRSCSASSGTPVSSSGLFTAATLQNSFHQHLLQSSQVQASNIHPIHAPTVFNMPASRGISLNFLFWDYFAFIFCIGVLGDAQCKNVDLSEAMTIASTSTDSTKSIRSQDNNEHLSQVPLEENVEVAGASKPQTSSDATDETGDNEVEEVSISTSSKTCSENQRVLKIHKFVLQFSPVGQIFDLRRKTTL